MQSAIFSPLQYLRNIWTLPIDFSGILITITVAAVHRANFMYGAVC